MFAVGVAGGLLGDVHAEHVQDAPPLHRGQAVPALQRGASWASPAPEGITAEHLEGEEAASPMSDE